MAPLQLKIVPEAVVKQVANWPLVIASVRRALVASADGSSSEIFPVVLGRGSSDGTGFGAKSGLLASPVGSPPLLGIKVGSYWPGNRAAGLAAHGSTTLLMDDATGFPRALVNAHYLNGMRTAAANACATDALARRDASKLAVFGAGGQSIFEVQATCQVRALKQITVVNRSAESAEEMAGALRSWLQKGGDDIGFASSDTEVSVVVAGIGADDSAVARAAAAADIITTVTPNRFDVDCEALFSAADVSPGTHISAMGADQPGKGELDCIGFVERGATFFCDFPAQSFRVGELQRLPEGTRGEVVAIGDVLTGSAAAAELTEAGGITVFDSSGIALQDVAAADAVLKAAEERGLIGEFAF